MYFTQIYLVICCFLDVDKSCYNFSYIKESNYTIMIIYQVFPRNHTKEGTFTALSKDLERIKALGVDVLYFLPIHPIGVVARKGKYGSPYSIQDYQAICEDLGTKEEFVQLINKAHDLGLKVMMDMVFHHTSRDADYIKKHPKWYIYKNGKLANKVGDWSDICDLEINNLDLQNYLIDTLIYWTKLGVDSFRFDVASLVPISFWKKAKNAVKSVNPKTIWLAESIEIEFRDYIRSIGEVAEDDQTLYQAFDILYDYDIFKEFKLALADGKHVKEYIDALNDQILLHGDKLKLHFLENHDQDRIASRLTKKRHLNWLKFVFMIHGVNFIYAGEEFGNTHKPDLFEKDPIDWSQKDLEIHQAYLDAIKMKKHMELENIKVTAIKYLKDGKVRLSLNKPLEGTLHHIIDLG